MCVYIVDVSVKKIYTQYTRMLG